MIHLYKSNSLNHGLVCVRGRWFLVFREDNVQRRVSLQTKDEATARSSRDAAYAKLLAEGAEIYPHDVGRPKIKPHGHVGGFPDDVFYRLPWQARIGKKNLGYFATMAEAEARVMRYRETNNEL